MFCAKLLLDDIMLLLNTGHPFAKLLNMKGPAFSRNILPFCLIWIDADLHHIIMGGLRVLSGSNYCLSANSIIFLKKKEGLLISSSSHPVLSFSYAIVNITLFMS